MGDKAIRGSYVRRARVLVVDDDALLLRAIARVVRPLADVECVSEGLEALRRIERGESFDVLILDVEMPRLNGRSTFERLRDVDPLLTQHTLIFTAGSCDEDTTRWLAGLPTEHLLAKPCSITALRASVARLLGCSDCAAHARVDVSE